MIKSIFKLIIDVTDMVLDVLRLASPIFITLLFLDRFNTELSLAWKIIIIVASLGFVIKMLKGFDRN